jgi:hypothetical protein
MNKNKIKDYETYLKEKGFSDPTISQYRNIAKHLPLELTPNSLHSFFEALPKKNRSRFVCATKTFLKYKGEVDLFMLLEEGEI